MELGRHLCVIPLSSFILLLLVHSANALCVPRNNTLIASTQKSPSSATSPLKIKPHVIQIPKFVYKSHTSSEAPSNPPQQNSAEPNTAPANPAFSNVSPGDAVVGTAMKAICANTDYPDVCETYIKPFNLDAGSINAKTVVGMLLRACTEQTNAATAEATRLMSDSSISESIKAYVRVCKDTYSDALDNLDDAIAALASGDKNTFNIMVSAAMTDFGSCEDGFEEIEAESPLSALDDTLKQIASNVLAVASSI
ncbi:pectinesterase inhibitor 1-like [Aristolochia californica]|uniref:pectinesterase inhibitor 1-like n=1 Tax=Aristolochia californica TaxID=171875 RepID=UPI0035DA1F9F